MSMVMPFIPFMVQRFLKGPEHSVGYYAGLLGAAYQLGQICFPFWGRISDRVGRRPVTLCAVSKAGRGDNVDGSQIGYTTQVMIGCLAASCVWILLFGAAPTLSVAFACRFAHGLCAGNVVVAKARSPGRSQSHIAAPPRPRSKNGSRRRRSGDAHPRYERDRSGHDGRHHGPLERERRLRLRGAGL